jgi:hypothetical protein
MSIARALGALFLVTLGLTGCGGVEGTYKLDKAEVKKAMEADIAKMPEKEQAMAKLGLAMIDAMDMTIELQPGGKLTSKMSMPSFDKGKPPKTEEKAGTWKKDGDSLVLDDGDGKPSTCTVAGNKLSCAGQKKGDPTLVFIKG